MLPSNIDDLASGDTDVRVGTAAEGTVTVMLNPDLAPARVQVESEWEDVLYADELGPALVEAYGAARDTARRAQIKALSEPQPQPPPAAAPSMFSALRRFRREQGDAAARRVASRLVAETREMLAANEDSGRSEGADSDSAVRHVGRDSGKVVSVALDASGALVEVDFGYDWVSARKAETITQRVNEALTDAQAVMAAATSDDPLAGAESTNPYTDPDAFIYRLAQ